MPSIVKSYVERNEFILIWYLSTDDDVLYIYIYVPIFEWRVPSSQRLHNVTRNLREKWENRGLCFTLKQGTGGCYSC